MPTLYKPILEEAETGWTASAKTIPDLVYDTRDIILETLNFHDEHGRKGEADGKFDKQIAIAEQEVLDEVAGILTYAGARAAEPRPGVVLATLKQVKKNPALAKNYTLPGFAEWALADHYQREQEAKATHFPDIMGFVPNGSNTVIQALDDLSIVRAASAAIDQLRRASTPGRPPSEANTIISERLRSIFLRYNPKVTRSSELTWRNGKEAQSEEGPFIDFLKAALEPLQLFLAAQALASIKIATVARRARYPIDSIKTGLTCEERDADASLAASRREEDNQMATESKKRHPIPQKPGPYGFYDNLPAAIERLMENPPLLPGEDKEQFLTVFDEFFVLAPESVDENWLVWQCTVRTWEVLRCRRMADAYVANQRRAAIIHLIKEAYWAPSMKAAMDPALDATENAERYFSDSVFALSIDNALQKAGYAAGAIESEMFARSLPQLLQFNKLTDTAEKRMMQFFREMERIHGKRALRAQKIAEDALAAETE